MDKIAEILSQNKPFSQMISVIIPTYNRFDFLLNAIRSVKRQTYKDVELIIVNDCSTDTDYLEHFNDSFAGAYGFTNITTETNNGNPSIPRNLGIQEAKGEWICFLDDDDHWLPNKLERQLEAMEQNNAFFSCTDGYYSDKDSVYNPQKEYQTYMGEHYKQFIKTNLHKDRLPKWLTFNLNRKHNYIITSSVMIHHSLIERVGQFVEGGVYTKWEDWSYWLRCMTHKDCLFIDEPLMFYNDTPRERHIYR